MKRWICNGVVRCGGERVGCHHHYDHPKDKATYDECELRSSCRYLPQNIIVWCVELPNGWLMIDEKADL